MSSQNKQSSGTFAASVAGILLGATAAAIYMVAKDKKKQEQMKSTFQDVKKTTADKLDQMRERLNDQEKEAEGEMKDLRKNGQGLTVH